MANSVAHLYFSLLKDQDEVSLLQVLQLMGHQNDCRVPANRRAKILGTFEICKNGLQKQSDQ
jgi:hypothetical protein